MDITATLQMAIVFAVVLPLLPEEASDPWGVLAPRRIGLFVSDPGIVVKLKDLGTVPFPEAEMSPQAHARLFASDLPRVAKLVESSGIKAGEAK